MLLVGWLVLYGISTLVGCLIPNLAYTHTHTYIYIGQDMTRGQFFKRNLTGLNSEFSFSQSLLGGRIIGFIPFPRVLVLCEMPSVSSRI